MGRATLGGALGISAIASRRLPHCLGYPITSPTRVWVGVSQELETGHLGTPPFELAAGQHFRLLWECADTGRNWTRASSSPVKALPSPGMGAPGKAGLPEREGVRARPAHGVARPRPPEIPRGRAGPRPGHVLSRAPAPGSRLARAGLRQETRARKMASVSSFPPPALDSCGRMHPRAAAGETLLLPPPSPPRAARVRAGGRAEAVARAHSAPRPLCKEEPAVLAEPGGGGRPRQGRGRAGAGPRGARPCSTASQPQPEGQGWTWPRQSTLLPEADRVLDSSLSRGPTRGGALLSHARSSPTRFRLAQPKEGMSGARGGATLAPPT